MSSNPTIKISVSGPSSASVLSNKAYLNLAGKQVSFVTA